RLRQRARAGEERLAVERTRKERAPFERELRRAARGRIVGLDEDLRDGWLVIGYRCGWKLGEGGLLRPCERDGLRLPGVATRRDDDLLRHTGLARLGVQCKNDRFLAVTSFDDSGTSAQLDRHPLLPDAEHEGRIR